MSKPDQRARFGWASDLDTNPQAVYEKRGKHSPDLRPVVVIPLPAKLNGRKRALIRQFAVALNKVVA